MTTYNDNNVMENGKFTFLIQACVFCGSLYCQIVRLFVVFNINVSLELFCFFIVVLFDISLYYFGLKWVCNISTFITIAKKSLKIAKVKTDVENRRRTDKTSVNRKMTNNDLQDVNRKLQN